MSSNNSGEEDYEILLEEECSGSSTSNYSIQVDDLFRELYGLLPEKTVEVVYTYTCI